MKKLLLLLISLTFIPVLNAETYYDYEKVEVEELPTAGEDTMNKVYIKGDSYYITESEYIAGTQRNIQEGDNLLAGKIIFKGMSKEQFETYSSISYSGSYASLLYYNNGYSLCMVSKNGGKLQFSCNKNQIFIDYKIKDFPISSTYLDLKTSDIFNPYLVVNEDYREMIDTFLAYEFDGYTTYSWKEVSKYDVNKVVSNKIYVPNSNISCYVFKDRNTLRGYLDTPSLDAIVDYYDFYIDQHYNSVSGSETITEEVSCLKNTTNNYLYRNDIVEILIFFVIVASFTIFLPIKVLFRLFRRFN